MFPVQKYVLSPKLVINSHLLLFLSKLVKYLRRKIASHKQTVGMLVDMEKFCVYVSIK